MKRITSKGGRVHPLEGGKEGDNPGPSRVWLQKSDIPGLAMSRSLGDYIAHSVGVIADPEIKEFDLKEDD